MIKTSSIGQLARAAEQALGFFAETARAVLGEELRALVLYGSAAVGQLRSTSDVNLIAVLRAFDPVRLASLREPLRTARAAVRLEVMFVLEHELGHAVEAFADKFADVARRRRVLFGADPFQGLAPSRTAQLRRLRNGLLNFTLRLRQLYLLTSLRDEQASRAVADLAGPLRSYAVTLRALEGLPPLGPREALATCAVARIGASAQDWTREISHVREGQPLAPGRSARLLLHMLDLGSDLRQRALALPEVDA